MIIALAGRRDALTLELDRSARARASGAGTDCMSTSIAILARACGEGARVRARRMAPWTTPAMVSPAEWWAGIEGMVSPAEWSRRHPAWSEAAEADEYAEQAEELEAEQTQPEVEADECAEQNDKNEMPEAECAEQADECADQEALFFDWGPLQAFD